MRVAGLQVPGGAFADLLMVQEFVHNFCEALDLGRRSAAPVLNLATSHFILIRSLLHNQFSLVLFWTGLDRSVARRVLGCP